MSTYPSKIFSHKNGSWIGPDWSLVPDENLDMKKSRLWRKSGPLSDKGLIGDWQLWSWLRGFSGNFFQYLEIVSGNSSAPLPEFSEFQILFESLDFGKSFRKIPWVMAEIVKIAFGKKIRKSSWVTTRFFAPVSFELECFITYDRRFDIMSRCTNLPNILEGWYQKEFLPIFAAFLW